MRNERRMSGSGRGGERPAAERWHGARRLLSPPRWPRAAARHDPRATRVHPPLSAPCPATWLPPHPPLRLARQFRTQGQYCAGPPTACRGAAAGARRRARTTRLAAALPLLRRAHDHHRDLRTMEPAPRATSRARINREHPVVTWHGLRSPHAAAPSCGEYPQARPFLRSARICWILAAARSQSTVRLAKNLTHRARAKLRAKPDSQ